MAYKVIFLLASVLICQGFALTEITLPEENHTYHTNDLIGKAFTIPKSFLDELLTCHVVFPNGVTYEAYPEDRLPNDSIFFLTAAQPFTSCGIGFRGASVDLSGSYELMSLVQHSSDNELSLTSLKINLEIKEIEY